MPVAVLCKNLDAGRLPRPGAVDEAFKQAVARQPVGSVQSAGGHFASREQAGNGRATVGVDGDAADHVVGTGPHRDPIPCQIEAKLSADLGHAGKPPPYHRRIEVGEIEKDVGLMRAMHDDRDRPGDHVARGELRPRVEVGHEPATVTIDQPRARAANGLGDQAAGTAGDVEHRGMKLHELHVAQLRAGPPGECHAIATRPRRIGRFAIELAGAASREDRTAGPDKRLAMRGIPDERPAAGPFVGDQIDREGLGPDLEILQFPRPLDHRPHHLAARGIAQGMYDAVMAVASFAAQLQTAVV